MRPLQCWVTQPGMGKPDGHSEYCGVDPAGLREEGKPYLRRSPFWSAHTGLPRQQWRGTEAEKSAEAIVATTGEGLNLRMLGADDVDSMTAWIANSADPNGPVCASAWRHGGTDLQRSRRSSLFTASYRSGPWRITIAFQRLKKPPYTSKYVRWCGRTGPRGPSYPIPWPVRPQTLVGPPGVEPGSRS